MGTLGKITRRAFMFGSAAIAGGVAFGYYKYHQQLGNPLKPQKGQATLNPYLLLTKDAITIITPRAEMGQGIHTTLAALVAEELDVDWQIIKTAHGPASGTYFNGAISGILPYPEYEESKMRETISGIMGEIGGKMMQMHLTGGSTSTKDAYVKMRIAGAGARQVLIQAAAQKWQKPASSLKTKDGFVIGPEGQKLSYYELAGEAANITPPSDPKLKDTSQWRYLGKNMPRVDMVEKITGTAQFGIDTKLQGMLFATVRMNPNLGAKMKSFDAKQAEKMPGVKKIVDMGNGIGVIAQNTWAAFQAAEAVSIEWEEAPYPKDTKAIVSDIEAALEAQSPSSTLRDLGDVNGKLKTAEKVIEAEYRVPFLAHATMEPMNATALYKDGELTVWAGNQAPVLVQQKAAEIVDLEPENVTVHTPYLGGGFGRRCEFDFSNYAAHLAKTMPGTPIKVTWSREEDMTHDYYRPAAVARFKGVMGKEGPTALKADIASPSVMQQMMTRYLGAPPPGPDRTLLDGSFDQPYAIQNYQVNGYIARTKVPIGPWRSVGNSFNGFFHESFIDELAVSQNLDPLTMRLNMTKGIDEASYKVLQAVGELAKWYEPAPSGKGRGIAFNHSFGTPVAQIIQVAKEDDAIRIEKVWCAVDVGPALDPQNVKAQLMSGIIFGLSAAVKGEITFENGQVVEKNFDSYDALRMANAPEVEVKIVQNKSHISGIGEPGTPPSMPALANAVFNLTGQRIRTLPLRHEIEFV